MLTNPNLANRDSIVCIVTGYGLDDQWVGVQVLVGPRILSSPSHLDQLWGPPNLLQWALEALSLKVKWLGHEADHSPPASAKVKKSGSIHPLPHTPSWHSVHLYLTNPNLLVLK
jgi:hypothetical protein